MCDQKGEGEGQVISVVYCTMFLDSMQAENALMVVPKLQVIAPYVILSRPSARYQLTIDLNQ